MPWVQQNVAKERAKEMLAEVKEESGRMTDTNWKSEKCRAVLLVGLTQKDYDALQVIAADHPKVKNYGVLVRRVLNAEAKRLKAPSGTFTADAATSGVIHPERD